MTPDTQRELARTFRDRHTEPSDGPLVLPNAWDAASAIVYEEARFDAVGTSSAGVAASLGVPDGEQLSRDEMLAVVGRIAAAVDLPVSADIEAGYGETPAAVAETVRRTIDAGAVGVNLEDGTNGPAGPLVPQDKHVTTIRAAREAADETGVPLVVNGRTDVFWRGVGDPSDRVERAVERANAYREAGSDCLFVPGVTDPETIAALVDGIDGPLNVLAGPGAPSIPALADLGVARVSVGSGPMRATLGFLQEIGEELRDEGTYHRMADGIPYAELHELLSGRVDDTE
ncbi:isocitrate lyase/PEP mutase family protein [Haloglomus litoreum]|uniref:isocitrate lyase/PEP mutase family protein n=1 Tax=Haloglomus litoreum TaxID=3034026 RepID=UPI0023E7D113|nr:isocitrate lyase/phosphoenolpyruvate mutase family protein [Haloglomus sp. DT116]